MKSVFNKNKDFFKELTLFIDPIDGTKQFVKGQGEMCAIMVGVVRNSHPVAGIVYRPLTDKATYAFGCKEEKIFKLERDDPTEILKEFKVADNLKKDSIIMLRSGKSHSVFLDKLKIQMNASLIRVSGAGNKILKIIELAEHTNCEVYYIQDRGISRWDSCAGEAILDAYGGAFLKLSSVMSYTGSEDIQTMKYHYRKVAPGKLIDEDIDLSINIKMTNTNTSDLSVLKPDKKQYFTEATKKYLPPYSNLCGLFATTNAKQDTLLSVSDMAKHTAKVSPPEYS